jgi:hypothetical protein
MQELKIVIQRTNNLLFEVMRTRNPAIPLDQQDITTLFQVFEVYPVVRNSPDIIPMLCSPDARSIIEHLNEYGLEHKITETKQSKDAIS